MSAPIRILELRSVRGTGGGPDKTILRGAAHADPNRFAVTVCYLRDRRDSEFVVDHEARRLGLDYVEVLERHSFDPRIWPALNDMICTRKIDIVHAHDYKTDLLALLLAWRTRVRPLATVHHWVGVSRREQAYYWCDKRLLRFFPRLIAVSQATRTLLVRAGVAPERIDVILNGIEVDRFRRNPAQVAAARAAFGLAADHIVLGAVCRLDPEKRLDVLLEAFARLRPSRPALRLLIAGDGSQRQALQIRARSQGIDAACCFLGHYSDIVTLHHALDVFIQSSSAEGTPNAVLEAMALETPLIATTAGGTAELVRDGLDGLLVAPGDVDGLAAAIERVLTLPDEARRRSAAARRRVELDFSFAKRMHQVEAIYETLAAGKSCAPGRTP